MAKKAWENFAVTFTPARRDESSLCQKIVEAKRSRELAEVDRRYMKRARRADDAVEQGRNAPVNANEDIVEDVNESEIESDSLDIVPFRDEDSD